MPIFKPFSMALVVACLLAGCVQKRATEVRLEEAKPPVETRVLPSVEVHAASGDWGTIGVGPAERGGVIPNFDETTSEVPVTITAPLRRPGAASAWE